MILDNAAVDNQEDARIQNKEFYECFRY